MKIYRPLRAAPRRAGAGTDASSHGSRPGRERAAARERRLSFERAERQSRADRSSPGAHPRALHTGALAARARQCGGPQRVGIAPHVSEACAHQRVGGHRAHSDFRRRGRDSRAPSSRSRTSRTRLAAAPSRISTGSSSCSRGGSLNIHPFSVAFAQHVHSQRLRTAVRCSALFPRVWAQLFPNCSQASGP